MPEGDTVYRTAAQLRAALVGKTLSRCDIRVPRYAATDLTGQCVEEVLSRGKHLFIRTGVASIHTHLSMDGSWRVGTPRAPADKVRVVLETGGAGASTRAVGIDLGTVEVLDRVDDMAVVAHLGPDLLGADWDPQQAAANLTADPRRPLAQTLLDQSVMAGVGNVYANELCFVFGHLPTAAVGTLANPVRVVTQAQRMLWVNRDRVQRCTTGDTRRGQDLWVYGRHGQPCRRCGTPISTDRTTERVSYWCPNCQR